MDGIHDMGGMHGFGPVDTTAVASGREGWEARLQVVAWLSGGLSRGAIEALSPDRYLDATYHERWLVAAEDQLLGRGVVERDALDAWQRAFSEDPTARPPRTEDETILARVEAMLFVTPTLAPAQDSSFAVGDRVRVKRMRPERHHRCPRYVRGALGTIEKVPGNDAVPELPPSEARSETVYTVRFSSIDLWGDRSDRDEPPYDLLIDLLQSYLEEP